MPVFPTAGLRQPLLVHGVGRLKNNDIRGAQTHVFQERRASARRGNETHLQWREFFPERVRSRTTAGLRQPLLVHGVGRLKNNDIRGAQTHVFQERRVSARRGNKTQLQRRAFFSGREYVRLPRLAYASRSCSAL
jgi:hypothetical protein